MTPIFIRIWLIKITSVFERSIFAVSLRKAWDISSLYTQRRDRERGVNKSTENSEKRIIIRNQEGRYRIGLSWKKSADMRRCVSDVMTMLSCALVHQSREGLNQVTKRLPGLGRKTQSHPKVLWRLRRQQLLWVNNQSFYTRLRHLCRPRYKVGLCRQH